MIALVHGKRGNPHNRHIVLDRFLLRNRLPHGKLLVRLLKASKERKACERHVLRCMERLLVASKHAASLAPKRCPHVLKALYDADVLSEEAIVEWHTEGGVGPKGEQVRRAVDPFITWLQDASEEEDDE